VIKALPMDQPKFTIEEVTDPAEVARFRAWHEQFRRNSDWLQAHWADVIPQARGRFVAVAGQQAFLGDTAAEALAQARAAYPEDEGAFVRYVFPPGGPRIYAHRG
jgi:hypothetical protein